MMSAGGRRIVAIAVVVGANEIKLCPPCGGGCQRIADEDTNVVLINSENSVHVFTIGDLIPASFALKT